MSERIQVILSSQEKARLMQRARDEGLSLSGWVRRAALAYTDAQDSTRSLQTPAELNAFFDECDAVEDHERESDWSEHLRVIEASRGAGRADT